MNLADRLYRPDDALLAGLCAELARRLGWNVWALRALFLVALFLQTLPTAAVYVVGALVMGLTLGKGGALGKAGTGSGDKLSSEPLRDRARRIEELEEKFRDFEREQR